VLLLFADRFGFAAGTAIVVTVLLALLWPLVLGLMVHRPADLGLLPDGETPPRCAGVRQPARHARDVPPRFALLRDPHFHTISLPFALGLTAQVGFLVHQAPYLLPKLGMAQTAWCIGVTTACAAVGRMAAGTFIDAMNVRLAAAVSLAIHIAAMSLLLTIDDATVVFLACALFGLGMGNMITLPALIVQREYPDAHFTRIVSLLTAISQITFAFGPGLLGLLRDWSGSYQLPLIGCMSLQFVAAVVVLAGMPHAPKTPVRG
jgi:predicted MFS family arabinose efflux permease